MTQKEFTLTELKEFDGKNGHKAYIAVDGVVYDVTGVQAWKNGTHHGNTAGNDLSEKILNAPHKRETLKKLNVVGKLI